MKVLFIRLSALGDVIHTLPAANLLKNELPDTKLSWIVEPPQLELLVDNPVVDEVIVMPKSTWVSGISSASSVVQTSKDIWEFFSELRNKKFDITVDFQGLMKSAIVGYASGAPTRVGYKGTRERSDLLYTDKFDVGGFGRQDKHVVDMHLELSKHLLRILGKTDVESSANVQFSFPPPKSSSLEKVSKFVDLSKTDKAPVLEAEYNEFESSEKQTISAKRSSVVLIPGTTWETKIWPYKNWTELAKLIHDSTNAEFLLVGGPGDTSTNGNIKSDIMQSCPDIKIVDTTGKTSILDLVSLFSKVDYVIGLDTGPLHLAAALNKPKVIAIHGSSPWVRNGPYGKKGHSVELDLSCQPCFKRVCPLGTIECLTDLSARHVFEKFQEVQEVID